MKILLALDDSKFAEAAIQAAVSQVRQDHTQVLVLHVVDWSNFSGPGWFGAPAAVANPGLRDSSLYRPGHRLSGSATPAFLEIETK